MSRETSRLPVLVYTICLYYTRVPIVYREQPWRRERLTPECPTGHGQRASARQFHFPTTRRWWRTYRLALNCCCRHHHHRCNTSIAERSVVVVGCTTATRRARAFTRVVHTRAHPIRSIISANIPAVVLLAARRVLLLLARRCRCCGRGRRRLRRRGRVRRVPGTKSKTTGGDVRA